MNIIELDAEDVYYELGLAGALCKVMGCEKTYSQVFSFKLVSEIPN